MHRKATKIAPVAVSLVTLAISLLLVAFHSVGYFGAETDFYGVYAPAASRLLEGGAYTYQHNPPGYSILLGLTSLATGDMFWAGKLLSALSTAALVLIACDLLTSLYSQRIALAASVLLALMLLPFSYLAATDVVSAAAMLLPLWVVLTDRDIGKGRWLLAGLCAGLAYLIRSNGIFVIGVLLVVGALSDSRESERRARRLVYLSAGFLIATLPWLVANWRMNGSPFASSAHLQVAAHFFHPSGDKWRSSLDELAPQFGTLLDVVLYDPAQLLRGYARGLWTNAQQLMETSVAFPAYLFVGAGLLLSLLELNRKTAALLVWGAAGYLLLALVGFYERYYLFLFPIFALWVVLPFFFSPTSEATRGSARPVGDPARFLSRVLLALLLGLLAFQTYRRLSREFSTEPRYVLAVANVLRERADTDDIIIARKPHVGYYAGLYTVPLPLASSVAEFRDVAHRHGASFLLFSEYDASLWPPLKAFEDPANVTPFGFHLVYRHPPTNTIIYEISNDPRE